MPSRCRPDRPSCELAVGFGVAAGVYAILELVPVAALS
jgi:hypothetical protein